MPVWFGEPVQVDVPALRRRLALRCRITQPELFEQAMTHRSYVNEAPEPGIVPNERLEFLGDAVLGFIIARLLFERYPDVPEGRLTELRSLLVKGETLAAVAERLALGEFLLLGRGEEATGGRTRPMNLARTFEAVVGAIYLGCGVEHTRDFILRALEPELIELGEGHPARDPKSRLQQLAQQVFGRTPRYLTVATDGPDHARQFTIEAMIGEQSYGSGRGRTKQIAQAQAALVAIERITEEHPAEARLKD